MLIAEARVETERSSRYLVQLCQHVNKAARAHPQMQARVEWSDVDGVISFGWGRCTLRADPGLLTLRAEAPDEEDLRRVQQRVADRLERIGRRDQLAVTWTPPAGAGEDVPVRPPTAAAAHDAQSVERRFRDAGLRPDRGDGMLRWVKVTLIVVGILVLLFLVLRLTGVGGEHSPSRHFSAGSALGAGVTELHLPPSGASDNRAGMPAY